MTDSLAPERRSWNMSRIRGKDTKPELAVRKALHAAGYRFRLHVKELPGKPDVVLPKWKTAIFVHGCFWHSHFGCKDDDEHIYALFKTAGKSAADSDCWNGGKLMDLIEQFESDIRNKLVANVGRISPYPRILPLCDVLKARVQPP